MQFFCDQCKTKYSIPDEKVAGKILKLRCKKCNNVIVLKDPRMAGSAESGPVNKGQRLLQDALKRSFSEDLATMDGSLFHASPEMPEERTQIARIPDFSSAPSTLPEEWYLSDSRGQFGPMDFAELVARIKRGEPDHDAVVWRDGFDDWKLIDRVPELRAYAKHLPPPRRATREMFRESGSFAPGATGTFTQPASASPFAAPAMSASQSFRNPTLDYGAVMPTASTAPAAPVPVSVEISRESLQQDRLRTWLVMVGVLVVVAGVAFWLGMKLMDKPSHRPEPQPVVAQNPPPQESMAAPEPPREEPMREVVYVIANAPPATPTGEETADAQNPPAGNAPKTMGTSTSIPRVEGIPTESPMTAPAGTPARSAADFNAVKQRNVLEIQRCYEMTVRKGQKELVGQAIQFNIRILPAGQVESVSFTGEMPPMMRACLAGAIQKWQFPAGTKTDTYSFEMHFN